MAALGLVPSSTSQTFDCQLLTHVKASDQKTASVYRKGYYLTTRPTPTKAVQREISP